MDDFSVLHDEIKMVERRMPFQLYPVPQYLKPWQGFNTKLYLLIHNTKLVYFNNIYVVNIFKYAIMYQLCKEMQEV